MVINLDLSPAVEAHLIQRAQKRGVPISRYIETLLVNDSPADTSNVKAPIDGGAYLALVHPVLQKFDELPRVSTALSTDEIIGFDEWGLPAK